MTRRIRTFRPSGAPVRVLQRKCSCAQHAGGKECGECQKKSLQRQKGRGTETLGVPPIVGEVLSSPGQPIDADTRVVMETRFRRDFSGVRLHVDAKAAESAGAVNAQAYTVGQDVIFGAGLYMPRRTEGLLLLAHELAHVVQQRADVARPTSASSLAVAPAAGEAEIEADTIARQTIAGDETRRAAGHHEQAVQRQPLPGQSEKRITLPSGLQLDRDIYLKMMMMCNEGKLDPLRCVEMRKMIEARLGKSPFGLPGLKPGVNESKSPPSFGFRPDQFTPPHLRPGQLFPSAGVGPSLSPPTKQPASPKASTPALGDLLTFKFKGGPVEITLDLPKSFTAKLPVALRGAKSLVFELKAETSGTFSFEVALDDKPHLRVALKAGLTLEREKGPSGSAGLEIQLGRIACHATNAEVLKKKVLDAGEKLKKAYQEVQTSTELDRISKLADAASAVAEMYEAVEKSKEGCKPMPAAIFNFGVQGPLSPDPQHPQPPTFGPNLKIFF